MLNGKRVRYSLDTANAEHAAKKLLTIEAGANANNMSVNRAVDEYMEDCETRELEASTIDGYRRVLEALVLFCKTRGLSWVRTLCTHEITSFIKQLGGTASSKKTRIEIVRVFLSYCVRMSWCEINFAQRVKPPKLEDRPVLPFTKEEHAAILKAIDMYPTRNPYGHDSRARLRAFVLALRYTALRISDVVKLKSSLITPDGKLFIRTKKTSTNVYLPLHEQLLDALAKIKVGNSYYFGTYRERTLGSTENWERLFAKLLKLAGVHGHPHMYRHMAAIEMLENGVLVEHVAAILGNTPQIVYKHYSPWIKSRQEALEAAVKKLWAAAA